MIKHVVTHYDDYTIKSVREYIYDVLVLREDYGEDGFLVYKEDDTLIYIITYTDLYTIHYIEDKSKDTWERHYFDVDSKKLFTEKSDKTWYENRYDVGKNKIGYIHSYGTVLSYRNNGEIYSELVENPESLCSFPINFEKTPNKFVNI